MHAAKYGSRMYRLVLSSSYTLLLVLVTHVVICPLRDLQTVLYR